jgi:GH15 family glucan-1,4-alpha-glucosidase
MIRAAAKIGDYGVIGDGRSAALVSRSGSLDWLCWPRFDSPSLFAALLDSEAGGSWTIGPTDAARCDHSYVEGTNVLESRFVAGDGTATLTDFMPAASEEDKRHSLWPEQELVRRVRCESGEIEIEVRFDPRPDYGRAPVAMRDAGPLGYRLERGAELFTLRSDIPLGPAAGGGLVGRVRLRAGQTADSSLTYAVEGPAVVPPLGEAVSRKLDLTVDWWRRWSARAHYDGPYRDEVVRSALVLKLLSYAPSGAIVAAPTTSLPERLGGPLNWDYRFCWLRDAAFTARALFGLGFQGEAEAFVSWLLHATRHRHPGLRVLYDVYGERPVNETDLPHLRGYAGSSPVRIGNATVDQLQLDVYGEVIEAVAHFVNSGGTLDRETQSMLRRFGEFVCHHWHEPDNGIWEPRGGRQHYTHSRHLCWVALDRLLELHDRGRLPNIPAEKCRVDRDRIRREIEQAGWNPDLQCYTQTLGGRTLDATALLMACHGFDDASSERMRLTYRRLRERLGAGPGLMYRYEQSFEGGEGTFALCSFWAADFLARGGGTPDAARDAFEHALGYANDLGLFAEEIDPATGDALGNFPQAYTHVGLINAALSLSDRERPSEAREPNEALVGAHR